MDERLKQCTNQLKQREAQHEAQRQRFVAQRKPSDAQRQPSDAQHRPCDEGLVEQGRRVATLEMCAAELATLMSDQVAAAETFTPTAVVVTHVMGSLAFNECEAMDKWRPSSPAGAKPSKVKSKSMREPEHGAPEAATSDRVFRPQPTKKTPKPRRARNPPRPSRTRRSRR
ncbi:MAG: hypothetical protein M1826_003102 [Phylliscum demangeonii]|nr:MAG: hypothetical protein M1826_003102 [Phylliscum demangeonii]